MVSGAGAKSCGTCPTNFFTHGGTDTTHTPGQPCRGVQTSSGCTVVGRKCDGGSYPDEAACTPDASLTTVGVCVTADQVQNGVNAPNCSQYLTETACHAYGDLNRAGL